MHEKIAFIVVKLLPEAEAETNKQIEEELKEAVDGVMAGYLPYKKEIVKVTVLDSPLKNQS